jgi:uncharacterized CHY-type Zn-finger protein
LGGYEKMPSRNVELGNAAAGVPGCLGDIYEEFEKEDMSEMFRRAFLEQMDAGDDNNRQVYFNATMFVFSRYFTIQVEISVYALLNIVLYNRKIHDCYVCREAIRGRVITAMAKKFHPQCFVCTYCRKEFKERKYKTDPVENMPYCYGCFEKLLGHFGNAHINDVFD